MQSITQEAAGRQISPSVVLTQLGVLTLMSIGMRRSTLTAGGDYVKFKVSRKYWMIVKLNASDTYDIEVGSVRKKNGLPEYKVIDQEHGIYAEQLSAVVLKMGDRP